MTDDLTHNLNLLADEAEPPAIDSHDIIHKAKARTRNQRAGLASALGTVAVVGVMAATIGLTGADSEPTAGAGTAPTGTRVTISGDVLCTPPETCDKVITPFQPDQRSLKLDGQLAPVISAVITPRWQLDQIRYLHYSAVEPLRFVPDGYFIENDLRYTAYAVMSNGGAKFELSIVVGMVPTGSEFGKVMWDSVDGGGMPAPPCEDGVDGCEWRWLTDGTVAAAQADATLQGAARNSNVTVQRKDGTYVKVTAEVLEDSDTQVPPFSNEDLFQFADVLTY